MQAENRLTVSYLQETSRKLIDLFRKKKYTPISKLEKLSELYLDDNGIEDLSPLLALPELKFVSLIGNPVTSMEVINALNERDVTVVWF